MLANLLCWFGVHLVTEEWFKQTLCVICYTNIYLICFKLWPVKKADTICYIIYLISFGYIWSLKRDLCIHTMLAISKLLFSVFRNFTSELFGQQLTHSVFIFTWSNHENNWMNISEMANTVCLLKVLFYDQMYPKSTQ